MNSAIRAFLGLLLIGGLAAAARAETKVDISGQVRVRNQIDDKSFIPGQITNSFQEMRTRITVDATVDTNAHAFVQFQDSRVFGDRDKFGQWQSGTLNDGKNVDIHQAYIQVDRVLLDGLGGKAGRFEFNLGNQRVFGAVGWSNVGRSWEGVTAWYTRPDYKITGFLLRGKNIPSTSYQRDFNIYGGALDLPGLSTELFGAYEYDANGADGVNNLDRISFGGYSKQQYRQFDLALNAVYQTGSAHDTIDIAAYMFTAEAGYTFAGAAKGRLALGIDYASGDDGTDPLETNTYNNLYYTGHAFRGHMDYFVSTESHGLMDLMLRGSLNPAEGWVLKTDVHYFRTAKDYWDQSDSAYTSDVGIEIDASVSTTRIKGIKFDTGVSVFLPQESFVRAYTLNPMLTESDPTFWVYNQATIDF